MNTRCHFPHCTQAASFQSASARAVKALVAFVLMSLVSRPLLMPAFGREYTVEGRLKYETLVQRHTTMECTFKVSVRDCEWAIEMWPVKYPQQGKSKNNNLRGFSQIFDGKTLVCKTRLKTSMSGIDGVVFVEENQIPSSEPPGFAPQIWLAYASICYLDGITNGQLAPVLPLERHRRQAGFVTPAEWHRFPESTGAAGLPLSIDYFFDEAAWSLKDNVDTHGSVLGNTNRQMQTKHLWARFSAKTGTIIAGTVIPAGFKFSVYEPLAFDQRAGRATAVYEVQGTTDSAREGIDPSVFIPEFFGRAVVDDIRGLPTGVDGGITYSITNAAPPPIDEPRLEFLRGRAEFLASVAEKSSRQSSTLTRTVFIVLSVIASACFALALVRRQRN